MKKDILELSRAYAAHMGLKLSTVSNYAANDGKLLISLEKRGSCTLATAEKILCWLSLNWPEDLEWPADIPRPESAPTQDERAAS